MTDAVDQWLSYLAQRNRSPETIKSYQSVMDHYPPDPLAVTLADADRWWAGLNDLSVGTRTRTLSCVRSFYKWAQRFDMIAADPTRRLDPPRHGRRLPAPMSRSDMHRVLAAAPDDLRRAVCLSAYAGLRVAEAASLDWSSVDVASRRIIVIGKGDNQRAVGLSPLLLDELMPDTGGNVVTAGGEPYSAAALQRKVNRLIRSVGVTGTSHKLRARFATVALAETGNLLAVSRALGHANVTTTAIYAATSDDTLDVIAAAVCR